MNILSRILDSNQKEVTRLQKVVEKINQQEPIAKKLKKTDFAKKTEEFKNRLEKGESLDDLLPEAFAVAREAAWRTVGMRAYDVQLMAATALFEGKVAEQKTGEGKTLSAVFPLYLRAIAGKGAHLVTVNDYLARVGAGWNAPVFNLLGLSTGVIIQEGKSFVYDSDYSDDSHGDERLSHLKPIDRKAAYAADITYGTNNEFGFDYLRDNMVPAVDQMVQRGHYFAIVDEVDSILIDEARTPLIISAPDTEPTSKYYEFSKMVDKLNPDTDFTIDEKSKSASLTEHGIMRVEKVLGVDNLYEKDFEAVHHIENALRARAMYLRDRDYIIKDNQVVIVDEFTGRLMPGRRWSDGLHQAVEAKENVPIQQESKTLATISFQNYFRLYSHLAGMTGTAATEAEEFKKIYKLDVVVVPTHRPLIRKDNQDSIYKTLSAKYAAIANEVEKMHSEGRPVLIGTTSIEKNEVISGLLKRKKVVHHVLNAKNHEQEAMILAEAGKPGAVTVATNMAGRGVDIVLGGAMPDREDKQTTEQYQKSKAYKEWEKAHKAVVESGGLHVIGTERHESRRIDNQLRGRSGRQGDPGSSRFYLSLEDDLMRIFGGEQIGRIMDTLRLPEDQPIENKLISRAIEQAQVKVEGFHFDTRKRLVEYDDVNNQQREIIYKKRREILESEDLSSEIEKTFESQVDNLISSAWGDLSAQAGEQESADYDRIIVGLWDIVPFDERSKDALKDQLTKIKDKVKLREFVSKIVMDTYKSRQKQVGDTTMRQIEKYAYLGAIDHLWIAHIDTIDGLRESVTLRAYGQRDPLVEFKNEAFSMFDTLLARIDEELSRRVFRIGVVEQPRSEIPLEAARENIDTTDNTGLIDESADAVAVTGQPAFANDTAKLAQASSTTKQNKTQTKIGRNDPCWCGSGKKWKKCHYPQLPQ